MSEALFNFHDTLLLATAFQSIFFVALILVAKRDHHISDYFLVGFFLAQAAIPVHLLINFGEVFRFTALEISPNLFRAFDIAYWIEGPLLLWYTRSLLFKEFKLGRMDLLFLAPAVLYLLYSLVTFFSWDTAAKLVYIAEYRELIAPSVSHMLEATRAGIFVICGLLCLIEIRHAQQQVHHRYSNILKIDFVWLASLVVVFMVLRLWILIVISVAFVAPDLGSEAFDTMGLAGNYLMFAAISGLIFFSQTKSSFLLGKISQKSSATEQEEREPDPALTQKIEQHMLENKPYLSHYLNLEQLAGQLSMHPRTLSVTIRNHFNTNFYEFINSYRIEEAKRLIEDPTQPHSTMIEILAEAGFNSKATFNSFFKKLVGMTPTQYKASKLKEKQA